MEETTDTPTTPELGDVRPCWFCKRPAQTTCQCTRAVCRRHVFHGHCLVCALGLGIFEREDTPEPVSDLIILSLSAAAGDPYIVTPPGMQSARPLPLSRVERLVGALVQLLEAPDLQVRRRTASVLANTTNSWPTMNPSQVARANCGTGLIATDQVRRWLLHALKQSRTRAEEPIALAILDKLRTADFRDLYPNIVANLKMLTCSPVGARVSEVFQALNDFYPTGSYACNERCELMVYEMYINQHRGASAAMERMYGPKLRYAPELARMLKKGVWHASYTRFLEWYPGEDEPL